MLKVNSQDLDSMERQYPGVVRIIMAFEHTRTPSCPRCGSGETAHVYVAQGERMLQVAIATTKVHLARSEPAPGEHWCNECGEYFD